MIICLDSGNSRIKWGVNQDGRWLAQGAVAHAEVARLADLLVNWPNPDRVMLANVAGEPARQAIVSVLAPWCDVFCEVLSSAHAGGVRNGYADPGRLGVDRWCALIGARARSEGACVVVMAGTATTIDTLDAEGVFLGGLILPGLDMMRRTLARDTAGLPLADGCFVPYPRCTADAIVSGAIEAQAGAIERAYDRLSAEPKTCLVSGGNAIVLSSALVIPHVLTENLPLDGLAVLAGAC